MTDQEKISQLKKVLEEIQWYGCLCSFPEDQGCPKCGGHDYGSNKGHSNDCPIKEALLA